MWEIRKRQAAKALGGICTYLVLCVSLMVIAALAVKLLPQSAARAIYEFRFLGHGESALSEEISDDDEKDKAPHPGETTVLDDSFYPIILKDASGYEGDATFVTAVSLARYTKSQTPKIFVSNQTSYTVNTDSALLANLVSGGLYAEGPTVLIYHTHGTESYLSGPTYEEGETFRSENTAENIVAVGEAFANELREYGVGVCHDTVMYDKENYSESYAKSKKAVQDWLSVFPSIRYVIDIHRDSVVLSDKQVKLIAEIDGETAAQIMIVVGTDEGGSAHTGWLDNFVTAVHLQSALNELYPTLARPIYLRAESFNQNSSAGALLLEIGSCGNTLEEAKTAAKLAARAMVAAFG